MTPWIIRVRKEEAEYQAELARRYTQELRLYAELIAEKAEKCQELGFRFLAEEILAQAQKAVAEAWAKLVPPEPEVPA